MTIDERLERLTARHEALTQTVELIAAMQLAMTNRSPIYSRHRGRMARTSALSRASPRSIERRLSDLES